jgi:membrane associated rhomboid family serine protease
VLSLPCWVPTSCSTPGSRALTYIFPVFFVHIAVCIFLRLWFLYQLIEADFGLFSASPNDGGVAFFAHAGGFLSGLGATWPRARAGQVTPARGPVLDD